MHNSWPADLRTPPPIPPKRKGKQKDVGGFILRRSDAPVLETGTRAAARSAATNGRLTWDFIRHDDTTAIQSSYQIAESVQVCPETLAEVPTVPEITAFQRAEQSARFLRTHYPDVDVNLDILEPFITEEHQSSTRSPSFDPFLGNRLASVTLDSRDALLSRENQRLSLILSAVGQVGGCLNVSPMLQTGSDASTLTHCPTDLKDFCVPILQIAASPVAYRGGPLIVVRTNTQVAFASLVPSSVASCGVEYSELDKITPEKTGAKPIMDVIFNPFQASHASPVAVLVDEGGGLWGWSIDYSSSPSLIFLCQIPVTSDAYALSPLARFWRMSWADTPTLLYVATPRTLTRVDMQTHPATLTVALTLHDSDGHLTSLVPARHDVFGALSTRKIFWLDAGQGAPLMMWEHGREEEDGLRMDWIPSSEGLSFCVSSSSNSALTIYQASVQRPLLGRSQPILVYCRASPCALVLRTPNTSAYSSRQGIQLLRHPSEPPDSSAFYIFDLTYRRSIFQSRVSVSTPGQTAPPLPKLLPQTNSMNDSAHNLERERSIYGGLGARVFKTLDLRAIYEELFIRSNETPEAHPLQGDTNVRTTLDAMVTRMDLDDSAGMPLRLLTRDIALRSSPDWIHPIGATFLSNGCLDTPAARKLLANGGPYVIPLDSLTKEAVWHFSLEDTVRAICPDDLPLPSHAGGIDQVPYCLRDFPRDKPSSPLETDATAALATDMALSLNVFSFESTARRASTGKTAGKASTAGELLSLDIRDATDMLSRTSLAEVQPPPPVEYGFLKPARRNMESRGRRRRKGEGPHSDVDLHEEDIEAENVDETGELEPLGVRLLLTEWIVGENAQDYSYIKPEATASGHYAPPASRRRFPTRNSAPDSRPTNSIRPTQHSSSQRPVAPPTIQTNPASSQPAPLAGTYTATTEDSWGSSPMNAFASQVRVSASQGSPSQNVLWASSTQPVPGPFGSRSHVGGKTKKKRIGGF